ncbi:MAG: Bcr/CflA family drug resistance efflux transporter [Waddliaceae bacterium]|nr:Bcr/CflA family drug resistance efflux transporter [Waddliaceae bacterium]
MFHQRRESPSILILICLMGFPQITQSIYTPSLPAVAETFLCSESLVELTLSIYFIGFSLGILFWGTLGDYIGRRRSMLYGLLFFLLASMICTQVKSIESLLLMRMAQAFFASSGSVLSQTMMRDLFSGKYLSQVFSICSGCLALSPAIGPVIGGHVSEHFGWQFNFWVLAAIGFTLLFWAYFFLPETEQKKEESKKEGIISVSIRMCKDPRVWSYVVLVSGANGILFSYYAEAPFFYVTLLGLSPTQYGWMGLVIACTGLVAARVSHRLNETWTNSRLVFLGASLITLGACELFVAGILDPYLAWGFPFAWFMVFLPFVTFYFGFAILVPNCLAAALRDYTGTLGFAGSIFGALYYVFVAISTGLMSYLHNGSLVPMTKIFLVLAFLILIMTKAFVQGEERHLSQNTAKPQIA